MRERYALASKRVTSPTATRSSTIAFQNAGMPMPSGVTTPIPVTATRCGAVSVHGRPSASAFTRASVLAATPWMK